MPPWGDCRHIFLSSTLCRRICSASRQHQWLQRSGSARFRFARTFPQYAAPASYEVAKLREAIESALGINRSCEAIIVGAGKLGSALLGYGGFTQYGITISHAFDTDSTKFSEYIRPLDELPSYCRMRQIEIGIITVPHDCAQETADFLIRSGVRAIWNFSSARLTAPGGITVQNESLALSLARLRQKVEKH